MLCPATRTSICPAYARKMKCASGGICTGRCTRISRPGPDCGVSVTSASERANRHIPRDLQRPVPLAPCSLEQCLMLDAVRCPRNGVESFCFDRAAVDQTLAECA